MRLGINTYTYMWSIGFEMGGKVVKPAHPLTAEGLLAKAHELGVSLVQMGPNLPLDQLSAAEQDRFIAQARQWGIALEHGTRGLETDHLQRQISLAKRMGARLLRTVPEINGQSPESAEMLPLLRRILPELERQDVRLGLENGRIPAAELRHLMDTLDSPHIGVVLDMVNSLAVPEGWKEVTRQLALHVMCLHFKDFIVKRHWSMMGFICEGRPAGEGQIEIDWLLNELTASRYDYNVIIELWTPEQETLEQTIQMEQEWALKSVACLRRYIP